MAVTSLTSNKNAIYEDISAKKSRLEKDNYTYTEPRCVGQSTRPFEGATTENTKSVSI